MKTIERYVFGAFFTSFLLAFLVLTFVMTIGLMVQIVGYVLDGVSLGLVGRFALVSFPETLQWTVPLGLLVASVLVFSRLSADSEIAAMRACGIHLLAVMKWPLAFAALMTALACYVNNEIVPLGHEVRNDLKTKVSVATAIDLLEPGQVIDDFPKAKIYFDSKEGNWLYGLTVIDYSSPRVERMVQAAKARVESQGRDVTLVLYEMTVDPIDADHPGMAHAHRYSYVMRDALKPRERDLRKAKDLRLKELLSRIREVAARAGQAAGADGAARAAEKKLRKRDLAKLKVELSKRFVFAMASLSFVLVGIPLGIRAQRRESSVGMAISLAISLGYYAVTMLMISLYKVPAIHPEALIWLPVAVCFALAAAFIRKRL